MAMRPIDQEKVQGTAQILLAFLSDENVSVPGNMVEGIVSGKSLLRAILAGSLFICEASPEQPPAAPPIPCEDPGTPTVSAELISSVIEDSKTDPEIVVA